MPVPTMNKPYALLAAVALLGASLLPSVASAQTVSDDGSVEYDTHHGGHSEPFHMDAGNYYFDWTALPLSLDAGDQEFYCGITLHVVTDDGRSGDKMLVNDIEQYAAGTFIQLKDMPAGDYSFAVYGCADLTSNIMRVS